MAWGHKNRKGGRQGSKSEQFSGKKGKKGGGQTIDGLCSSCGGIEGRHNQVRMSRPIYNSDRTPSGRYKIVNERCPNA